MVTGRDELETSDTARRTVLPWTSMFQTALPSLKLGLAKPSRLRHAFDEVGSEMTYLPSPVTVSWLKSRATSTLPVGLSSTCTVSRSEMIGEVAVAAAPAGEASISAPAADPMRAV